MIFLILILPVYAENDSPQIDLTTFPKAIAEALNIPVFAGGILCSMILIFMWMLPLNILRRGIGLLPNLIIGVGLLAFCVAIGWLPYWIMLLISLIIASVYSNTIKKWLGK